MSESDKLAAPVSDYRDGKLHLVLFGGPAEWDSWRGWSRCGVKLLGSPQPASDVSVALRCRSCKGW